MKNTKHIKIFVTHLCAFFHLNFQQCKLLNTVRAPREVHWEWGEHERLRCTLSQNTRPPLQHCSKTQCIALLETTGIQCAWNRNRLSAHAQ
jgi:hypothetical protein